MTTEENLPFSFFLEKQFQVKFGAEWALKMDSNFARWVFNLLSICVPEPQQTPFQLCEKD
jgi:hypothetical protein